LAGPYTRHTQIALCLLGIHDNRPVLGGTALIRATRQWGGKLAQGSAFGLLDGGAKYR
jgi:hypothetical protein